MSESTSGVSLLTGTTWSVVATIQPVRILSNTVLIERRIAPVRGLAFMRKYRLSLIHEVTSYRDVKSLLPVLTAVETLLTVSPVLLVNKDLEIPGFDDVTLLIQME